MLTKSPIPNSLKEEIYARFQTGIQKLETLAFYINKLDFFITLTLGI